MIMAKIIDYKFKVYCPYTMYRDVAKQKLKLK